MLRIILSLLLIITFFNLYSQDMDNNDQDLKNDVINVNYQKKSTLKAVILSSITPGLGQFYIDKSTFTAYLFPVLEIACIGGYLYFNNEGNDITSKFENFADKHYDRSKQEFVENDMIEYCSNIETNNPGSENIYDDDHFLLDDTNTQHFYEDIGKYDKYIFGWSDWYDNFVDDTASDPIKWNIEYNEATNKITWYGNYDPSSNSNISYEPESALRDEYDKMRDDANTEYKKSNIFTFALAFNHIAAAIDAARVSIKYNRGYISSRDKVKLNLTTQKFNNNITPTLMLTKRF